jgi:ribosomal protein L37AE/L43A
MNVKYWLFLEKSDKTRVSQGIDGYRDATGEEYQYDSLVPNYRQIATGDYAVIRKENEIIGVGTVGKISELRDSKIHRRCPDCSATDIRERFTKKPKWKCGKCAKEFSEAKETIVEVQSFVASIDYFTRLKSPPTVQAVKKCSVSADGILSQLSMLRLDPAKIQNLLEGDEPYISSRTKNAAASGQGFGLSHAERRVVELRAMQVARTLYESAGWEVTDQSLSNPFDLLATKNGTKRFIEVKGTIGDGFSVIITQGEVKHVSCNPENSALVVVSRINLTLIDGVLEANGGIVSTHKDPWLIVDKNLSPTQYCYQLNQ